MSCRIELLMDTDPQSYMERLKKALARAGGSLEGDALAGSFEVPSIAGTISGSYTANAEQVFIEVTDKPFFLPCELIASTLKRYVQR